MVEVVVTTGAISRAKLQSNHHQQKNQHPIFYRPDALLLPNQQCQSTERTVVLCLTGTILQNNSIT